VVTPGELDHLLAASTGTGVPPLGHLMRQLHSREDEELTRAAAGPLAHLACRALVGDLGEHRAVPEGWMAAILVGIAEQSSALALLDATDELLGSAEFVQAHGIRLYEAFLRGHTAALKARPLVAAAFAEGTLRLAIAGVGSALRALTILTPDDLAALDSDYVERLPRLVGAALDVWGADGPTRAALRTTLSGLQGVPDAAADATFECGLDALRQVAGGGIGDVPGLLVAARKHFANVEAAEEARPDAALYGAGIDAVTAFFRGSAYDVRAARAALSVLLDQRAAWLRRSHVPTWRRPRVEAAYAWGRLTMILDRALQATAPPVWLDAWSALDAILDAYVLDRSVVPVPGVVGLDRFARLIQPVIESSLIRRQGLLAQLRYAVEEAERAAEQPARMDQLRRLRDRLAQPIPRAADSTDPVAWERLGSIAPALLAELGTTNAATVAGQLDDDGLRLVEGAVYRASIARAGIRDPVIARLLGELTIGLQPCPDYAGEVRHAFDALVEETVMFLATRHDLQRSERVDYLTPTDPPPREGRLQNDYADWLRRGPLTGRIDVEVPNVATGRADVKLGFGTTRFFVEVKRELRDSSRQALERSYLTQAADYSGTSAALGILLVLDLAPHPSGVRHLSECAWVTRHRPAGSTVDRYIVVAVVIGNRGTPSSYSRAAK
jgi:hypothetical protein